MPGDLYFPQERLDQALGLFQTSIPIGSNIKWDGEAASFPLNRELVSSDLDVFVKVLASSGIDPFAVGEKINTLYQAAGKPKTSGELEDLTGDFKNNGDQWIHLIDEIKEFVSTSILKTRVTNGELLNGVHVEPISGNLTQSQRNLPFESRRGWQNNTLFTVGGYYKEYSALAAMKEKARATVELSKVRTRDNREQDLIYINAKFDIEKFYLEYLLQK